MFTGSTKQVLASIGLGLGLAVMTFTAPLTDNAHAAPTQPTISQGQEGCESRGYMWDGKTKKCADRPCGDGGTPGDVKIIRDKGGSVHYFYCNGFIGRWVAL